MMNEAKSKEVKGEERVKSRTGGCRQRRKRRRKKEGEEGEKEKEDEKEKRKRRRRRTSCRRRKIPKRIQK